MDGTCAEEGLTDITTKEDCEVACAALGRVGNKKGSNFVGIWQFKGPQCFVAVKGMYVGNCHWNKNKDGTEEGRRNRAVCKLRSLEFDHPA